MKGRIAALVRLLRLQPHPEGGYYRECFRSPSAVTSPQGVRAALTTIYFLMPRGDVSRWHRVKSDEVWHYIEGAPLRIYHATAGLKAPRTHRLGPVSGRSQRPIAVIPANRWQAAESTGAYTLAACDVGPGFAFSDFTLLRDEVPQPQVAPRFRRFI